MRAGFSLLSSVIDKLIIEIEPALFVRFLSNVSTNNKKQKHRPKAVQYYNPTMSFIEKNAALPEIMTISPVHSQYRTPVHEDAWKAVM